MDLGKEVFEKRDQSQINIGLDWTCNFYVESGEWRSNKNGNSVKSAYENNFKKRIRTIKVSSI